ncbi:MAG: DUF1161 domain-containing protein [Hydrogenophaga sp.]|nr:DUF1161 domain-containing protein [Hydrogenophaga sp.]
MSVSRWGVMGLSLAGAPVMAGDICEPLREQIEVQIAGTGKTGFAVVVADVDAPVAGKVVGTCAKGTRKLVYVLADNAGGRTARPAPPTTTALAPARPRGAVITECRDGSVVTALADCKP